MPELNPHTKKQIIRNKKSDPQESSCEIAFVISNKNRVSRFESETIDVTFAVNSPQAPSRHMRASA